MSEDRNQFSIGALSQASGIPVETLRTWERRYGFPAATRTPTGHRRYSSATVERLRQIKVALDSGHRASEVVSLPVSDLGRLLDASGVRPSARIAAPPPAEPPRRVLAPAVAQWLELIRAGRLEDLELAFRREWAALSAEPFLTERAGPFLWEVGDRWADGTLSVMQEHAASQRLRDFLAEQWRPLSDRNRGPRVVCATLPGEQHDIGAQMAAAVLTVRGARVVYLGADTPVEETARTIPSLGVRGVALSISVAAPPARTSLALAELRRLVPAEVPVIVGGGGARWVPEGITRATDLGSLAAWLDTLSEASSTGA